MSRRSRLRAWPVLAVFVVVAIQFVPARIHPRGDDPRLYLESAVRVNGEVGAILRNSCYDCHGGPTHLPWYGRVAPVSWLLAHDINESMQHVDFSRWGNLEPRRQAALLEEMCDEVRSGEMPLPMYAAMHAGAKLSQAQRQSFCRWAESEQDHLRASAGGRPAGGASGAAAGGGAPAAPGGDGPGEHAGGHQDEGDARGDSD